MDLQVTKQHVFEGLALTPILFRGKPAFLLPEVERALGYEPFSITKKLRGEWAQEFEEGEEYVKVAGEDLAALKTLLDGLLPLSGSSVAFNPNTRHVSLLYKCGVNLVCIKTEKPAGIRLRRFLARTVLPALETGTLGGAPDPVLAYVAKAQELADALPPGIQRGRALRLALDVLAKSKPHVLRAPTVEATSEPERLGRPPKPLDPWEGAARGLLTSRNAITVPELLALLNVPETEAATWEACTRAGNVLRRLRWRAQPGPAPRVYRPAALHDMPVAVDPWNERVRRYVEGIVETTSAEVLRAIGAPTDDRPSQMKVAAILRGLGFNRKLRRYRDNRRLWVYLRNP